MDSYGSNFGVNTRYVLLGKCHGWGGCLFLDYVICRARDSGLEACPSFGLDLLVSGDSVNLLRPGPLGVMPLKLKGITFHPHL